MSKKEIGAPESTRNLWYSSILALPSEFSGMCIVDDDDVGWARSSQSSRLASCRSSFGDTASSLRSGFLSGQLHSWQITGSSRILQV